MAGKGGAAKKIYHLYFYVEGKKIAVVDPVTKFIVPFRINALVSGCHVHEEIRLALDAWRKREGLRIGEIR